MHTRQASIWHIYSGRGPRKELISVNCDMKASTSRRATFKCWLLTWKRACLASNCWIFKEKETRVQTKEADTGRTREKWEEKASVAEWFIYITGLRRVSACLFLSKEPRRDFSDDPVAKTPCSQCRGPEFDPWSGNWIPHATSDHLHASIKDPTCYNQDPAEPNK